MNNILFSETILLDKIVFSWLSCTILLQGNLNRAYVFSVMSGKYVAKVVDVHSVCMLQK